MASKKETLDFVLAQLVGIDNLTWRKMMGEYIIYYKDKVVAGIYDDRFLVKKTKGSSSLLSDAVEEQPYEGGKPMLSMSDIIFDNHFYNSSLVKKVFDAILNDIK